MTQLAIKGHATRGKEVIEILEMLGGENYWGFTGNDTTRDYYIESNRITICYEDKDILKFTLEEFLEKFPYKIGDKVQDLKSDEVFTIANMFWDEKDCTVYYFNPDIIQYYNVEDLKLYKEINEMSNNITLTHSDKEVEKKSLLASLKEYFKTTPKDVLEREWNEHKELDEIGPTVEEYIDFAESFKKNPKYPETYEEDNYCKTLEIKVLGYKVGDVIFTNNTGWIRITNKLWNCYAEEYVYEGIGVLSEQEYNNIRHKDIINKMEADSVIENMKESITPSPYITANITDKNNCGIKCPDGYEFYDENGNLIGNNIMMIPKKPQYPKTYKDCCEVLIGKTDFQDYSLVITKLSTNKNEENSISPEPPHITLINNFYKLLICRDAYWKIAGEQMGFDKPWKPDWTNTNTNKYCIYYVGGEIKKQPMLEVHHLLAFPTSEMRDAFYENFKDLIETCKELI